MGPHLYAIIMGVRLHLEEDSHADQLRATLMQFNTPMDSASLGITSCFTAGVIFYQNEEERRIEQRPITQEMVGRLLRPDFQARRISLARRGMSKAAAAAKTIREEVLPLLSQVQKDLEDYVSDYIARDALKRERKRSWVPSLLQNAIEGEIDPTPWEIGEVKQFPQRFAIASDLLRRLPSFLDNVELHFRRLIELNGEQIHEYGYTTFDNLVRLYQDRLLCSFIFSEMRLSWVSADKAFGAGALKEVPGQNLKRNRK